MLKEFIACKSQKERFLFFDASKVSDWDPEEFDVISQITGIALDKDADMAKKYMTLDYELGLKAQQIA